MINLFKRKKKAKKDIFEKGDFNIKEMDIYEDYPYVVSLVYMSPIVETIYPACASCYGISEEKNTTTEERIGYIGKRVKSHHTSILEHSNIVMQIHIALDPHKSNYAYDYITNEKSKVTSQIIDPGYTDKNILKALSEIRDICRYLTIHTDTITDKYDNPMLRLTIGGSIRGYRYIFENIKNRQNKLFVSMFTVLKSVVPKEFFIDFINDNVMDDYFTMEITKELSKNIIQKGLNTKTTDILDIINMDDLNNISELTGLSKEDCFDFVSITVDFKNMSRVITQQLTRHRNGITQESQRYVDYSDASFNSPAKFKDKYSESTVYHTPIGDYNLSELGYTIASIYRYLVDQGVEKEDARGYLPQNIQSGKVFMTFTLRTLFAFFNLRLDPHAQAEIRIYAEQLAEYTEIYAKQLDIDDMYLASSVYSAPLYLRDQNNDLYNDIDEEV